MPQKVQHPSIREYDIPPLRDIGLCGTCSNAFTTPNGAVVAIPLLLGMFRSVINHPIGSMYSLIRSLSRGYIGTYRGI